MSSPNLAATVRDWACVEGQSKARDQWLEREEIVLRSALSSKLGFMLRTIQVVRGSVGLAGVELLTAHCSLSSSGLSNISIE